MTCCIHGFAKEASGICVYCGKPFCEDCLIDIDGKNYCKEHVKLLVKSGGSYVKADISGKKATLEEPLGNIPNAEVRRPASKRFWDDPAPSPQYDNDNAPYSADSFKEPHPAPSVTINNNFIVHDSAIRGMISPKNRVVALLLCFFFGIAGFHRFYVGKIGTGLIWLFTGGLFGIGYIVDLLLLIVGSFTDSNGFPIK